MSFNFSEFSCKFTNEEGCVKDLSLLMNFKVGVDPIQREGQEEHESFPPLTTAHIINKQ